MIDEPKERVSNELHKKLPKERAQELMKLEPEVEQRIVNLREALKQLKETSNLLERFKITGY